MLRQNVSVYFCTGNLTCLIAQGQTQRNSVVCTACYAFENIQQN